MPFEGIDTSGLLIFAAFLLYQCGAHENGYAPIVTAAPLLDMKLGLLCCNRRTLITPESRLTTPTPVV